MKDQNILLVGCGVMGGAILSGCLTRGIWQAERVFLQEHNREASVEKAKKYGVQAASGEEDLSSFAVAVLAVKPATVSEVLADVSVRGVKRVLSVAAAVSLSFMEERLPVGTEVLRVMPNTPASVGAGMTAITAGSGVSDSFLREGEAIFSALGRTTVVSESELDALGALSGAGPGYAFVILDALSDAGVRIGLSRKLALEAAAQTLYGAAKMALDTGTHPAVLRDRVTSPGGTTIAGIHALEAGGVRAALMNAVTAALQRSDEMSE